MIRLLLTGFTALLAASCGAPQASDQPGDLLRETMRHCPDKTYGTSSDRETIQNAMLGGTEAEVTAAINRAKASRGTEVGCPQGDYGPRVAADVSKPSLREVEALWNNAYRTQIESYTIGCPQIGRSVPALALGSYYARLAGEYDDLESLAAIGRMLEAQQYSQKYAPGPLVAPPGVYGYFTGQGLPACGLTGVPGDQTAQTCSQAPELCVTYDDGIFAGLEFAVSDHVITLNDRRRIAHVVGDLGGAGYDMGWATVMMIEAALQQEDADLRSLFEASALLAGSWALVQPMSANHNYTSKIVWLLAYLYNWTGREEFRQGVVDRLNNNLKPGVLMDRDEDGLVDGMNSVAFADLHPIAQQPGRNYDAHNALPWYHSMNAWAAVESYVAFRDRGDVELANDIRPYAVAMLDNLAHELVHIGVPADDGPGARDVPFSLLLGIWKIAQYENEEYPLWEQAAWAIWNNGVFADAGTHGLNIGLYLLILSETPYVPLGSR